MRFYLDHGKARKNVQIENVQPENWPHIECIALLEDESGAVQDYWGMLLCVCRDGWDTVDPQYLGSHCSRITRDVAERVDPGLFQYLYGWRKTVKGYRFYLDCGDLKRSCRADGTGPHRGNCLALILDENNQEIHDYKYWDAISCIRNVPNSEVCFGSISRSYLSECHIRVSEAVAREIHPRLFTYLETAP